MKISIVTVVFNGVSHLDACIRSVLAQDYPHLEYIIIDGGSQDGSIAIAQYYQHRLAYYVSVPDCGIYDAFNKGIAVSTGEIVGMLNADDRLTDAGVIRSVAAHFQSHNCQAVYGHLRFVHRKPSLLPGRYWKSAPFHPGSFKYGWAPAHPTLYLRRSLFDLHGVYTLRFGFCSDYEFMLRLFVKGQVRAVLLDKELVVMTAGGSSNGSLKKIWKAMKYDYQILIFHRMPFPLLVLLAKRIRKIPQFFRK
jgi:glycosyltransferase involved in cell wall biosynthesis